MLLVAFNGDSLLMSSELKDIWVWEDANTDAILAPDEVSRVDAARVCPQGGVMVDRLRFAGLLYPAGEVNFGFY